MTTPPSSSHEQQEPATEGGLTAEWIADLQRDIDVTLASGDVGVERAWAENARDLLAELEAVRAERDEAMFAQQRSEAEREQAAMRLQHVRFELVQLRADLARSREQAAKLREALAECRAREILAATEPAASETAQEEGR